VKKFKINYLVRYYKRADGITHAHNYTVRVFKDKDKAEKLAMLTVTSLYNMTINIKAIEIGEIEEVTNEG
jgi:hypothetical protein